MRGVVLLLLIALLAGAAALVPVKGELLGLIAGLLGMLGLALVVPQPERHPFLALGWLLIAFALPVTLVLLSPSLPEGLALTLGGAGLWPVLVLTRQRLARD